MPIENSVTVPQQAKELETVTVTTGAGLVHRQVVVIGDQDDPDERLTILDGAVAVKPVGVTPVSIATLPAGIATTALQTAGNDLLNSIDQKLDALEVDTGLLQGLTDDQLRADPVPVSLAGAATAALQTAGNASLASLGLDSTLNTLLKPASTLAAVTTLGSITGPVSLPTGAATAAAQTTGNASLASIDSKIPTVGQKAMAASQPVVMASDQSPIITRDYGFAVSQGLIAGAAPHSIRGYNAALTPAQEPVWAQSGATYPVVTVAQTLTLSSASGLDTAAGTGARTVLVTYIRFSDGVEVSAVFTLNGLTAVTVTTDGYAINNIRVLTAGTLGSNQGVIYVGYGILTAGVPLNILSTVVIGKNNAQQAIYTVPTGKLLMLTSYRITPTVGSLVQLRTRSSPTAIQVVEFDMPLNNAIPFDSPIPAAPFAAGMQIQFWAATVAGAGQIGILVSGELRSV
jgi:hypothetical protein